MREHNKEVDNLIIQGELSFYLHDMSIKKTRINRINLSKSFLPSTELKSIISIDSSLRVELDSIKGKGW